MTDVKLFTRGKLTAYVFSCSSIFYLPSFILVWNEVIHVNHSLHIDFVKPTYSMNFGLP